MNAQWQKISAWCGIAFTVCFFIGWWAMAGLVPPPSPNLSAAEIARFYSANQNMIRGGLILVMAASPLMLPFVALISIQMKRIEGSVPLLAYTQFGAGTLGVLVFVYPVMLMQAAAFRPDRNPEVTQGLNDAAYLPFLGIFSIAFVENLVIALAIFSDKRPEPVFPRWVGYFNIWVALGFVPAAFNPYFKVGPIAWDGVFTFWIPATVFFAWFIVMFVMLLRAIKNEELETAESTSSTVTEPVSR
jgi:hypothetical protein